MRRCGLYWVQEIKVSPWITERPWEREVELRSAVVADLRSGAKCNFAVRRALEGTSRDDSLKEDTER